MTSPSPRHPRAGIVGPGGIGRVHADALRRLGVPIAAVASSDPARAAAHATAVGALVACASAAELIARDDVDVVHVCTPNHLHAEQCAAALAAGKHVVAEKPLATSVADARALRTQAERAGVVHAVCHNYRYYPMVRALGALVARGDLGRVHLVQGSYLLEEVLGIADGDHWMLDPARMGPALTLADVGVHWWDLVEHVLDRRCREVLCERRSIRFPERPASDDTSAILLELDGVLAAGTICQAAPGHGNTITLELFGDRASAGWDIRTPDRLVVRPLGSAALVYQRGTPDVDALVPELAQLPFGQPQGQADAFRDLLAAVYAHIGDRTTPAAFPTFADGVHGVEVLAALIASAERRAWTAV